MSQNFKRVRDLRIGQFLYFKIKLYNVCEVYYQDGASCWGPLFTAKFKKKNQIGLLALNVIEVLKMFCNSFSLIIQLWFKIMKILRWTIHISVISK